MRLIDADWVAERLKEWRNWIAETYGENDDYVLCLDTVLMKLDDAPTADVEPVKHGHWEHGKELSRDYIGYACIGVDYDKWWCSECNYHVRKRPSWKYCPCCGAKMDEVKDETD